MLDSLKMREIKGKTLFKNILGIKGMLSIYTENKWSECVIIHFVNKNVSIK